MFLNSNLETLIDGTKWFIELDCMDLIDDRKLLRMQEVYNGQN